MRVQLLGTGDAQGWPRPCCPCASCGALRASGSYRGPGAALVDDRLLLLHSGWIPQPRLVALDRVRAVLLLGAGPSPLELPASVPVLDVVAGTSLDLEGYAVKGLSTGALTVRRGGERLLWSLDGHTESADVAFLACPDGDVLTWGAAAATSGAATVVPIGMGHGNRVAQFAGTPARVMADGDVLEVGDTRRMQQPQRVLITGGARSGKSAEAERRLALEPRVTYVATSLPRPGDESWAMRVKTHRVRRPAHWTTVETTELLPLLADPDAVLLIDCATLWLGSRLESPTRSCDIDALVGAWRETRARVVMVTNEVGSSIHPASELGRDFADELGRLNARLAEESDEVWLCVAGQPLRLR